MEVKEAICRRRSIRKFKPDPVPEAMLHDMLEMSRLAPSAGNKQPWRFVVVRDIGIRKRLRECCYGLRLVEEAPCIFVCCADLTVYLDNITRVRLEELEQAGVFDDVGELVFTPPVYTTGNVDIKIFDADAQMNCAITITHMVLTATSLGLGSCWVGLTDRKKVHKMFSFPSTMRVLALLAVGFPNQDPPPRPRLPLKEIVLQPIEEVAFSLTAIQSET
ncbi:nitroreductase family protein [Chloroflexota bacterium]